VLHFGRIEENRVEQVKGVTYSLPALLGKKQHQPQRGELVDEAHFAQINSIEYSLDRILGQSELKKHDYAHPSKDGLFFCVVYLAPGDYHRFHSPTAWQVLKQRHFAGELFSVSPWMVRSLRNLFVLNERVALLGHWTHGFFGMIPVGATNVGSIKIKHDEALQTNRVAYVPSQLGQFEEKDISWAVDKGEEMGGFKLGSTVVLVFEAPDSFEFAVDLGEKVKVGQSLGRLSSEK
jgi:phosphatidylserine decarboxylase